MSAGVFWTQVTKTTKANNVMIAKATTIGRKGPETARIIVVTLAETLGDVLVEVEVAAKADAGNPSPCEEEVVMVMGGLR